MSDTPSQPPGPPPSGPSASQGYPQQYQRGGPSAYGAAPQGSSGPRASFGQRLGAWLLDLLILIVPLAIIAIIMALAISPGVDESTGEVDGAAAGISILLWVLISVGAFAYYILLEGGATGQTLGKKAVGIRVVSMQTGGPIGYGKAFVRTLIRSFISGNICLLGYLWMLWDKEKQTWHDKISDSVVVPVSAYPIQR
nr:RDD family protein [Actinomycetota bacterium]